MKQRASVPLSPGDAWAFSELFNNKGALFGGDLVKRMFSWLLVEGVPDKELSAELGDGVGALLCVEEGRRKALVPLAMGSSGSMGFVGPKTMVLIQYSSMPLKIIIS